MTVRLESIGAVAVVTIDRPPVNALDTATYVDLGRQLDDVRASDEVRCLVLCAAGDRAFSAGADIHEFEEFMRPGAGREMATRIHELQNGLEAMPIVTIVAIEGAALGGGCELSLACDLRVAGSNASFGFPEVRVGQFPGTGGTMRLPWLIGESQARLMLLSGEPVDAARAAAIGLVHRLVPAGEARATAIAWASDLARLPASGVRAVKTSVVAGRTGDTVGRSLADAELSESVFQSHEAGEGYRAFLEKRPPDFRPLRS
jgi:enoyl-CoA hydratase/carnithine racemase